MGRDKVTSRINLESPIFIGVKENIYWSLFIIRVKETTKT